MYTEWRTTMARVEENDDDVMLPGFRFHPTDEELVDFYLRRKVAKKPLSVEIIKEIDIYKYDPWDLPKVKSTAGDGELFFFCLRGRKYRNSIRPNRVTGSGFWKATGIDKPIYSGGGSSSGDCIGLKKSLVYYRGSAGKGTKTEWMMHEFRLPSCSGKMVPAGNEIKAAASEVWTICRIFKRNSTFKKQTANTWKASHNKQIDSNNSTNNTADNYYYYSVNSSITTTTTTTTNTTRSFANSSNPSSPSSYQEQEEQNQLVYCNSITQSPQFPDYLIQSPSMDELLFNGDKSCNWEAELGSIMEYFMAD